MEQCTYWKITLKPTEKKDRTDEITAEDFSVRAALTEGRLDLSLTGRVDTLTAPRVLELYEKISEDAAITGIVVDCSKLQYISSAGLRVLLIMQKKHGVKLVAVNSVVMEILETTGFDSILEVEE
jgi:anti-anti-sigma factor